MIGQTLRRLVCCCPSVNDRSDITSDLVGEGSCSMWFGQIMASDHAPGIGNTSRSTDCDPFKYK